LFVHTHKELFQRFLANVEDVAAQLVSGFRLTHNGPQSPIFRWLDFRLRTIDPRPRAVYFSDNFPKPLDASTSRQLQKLEQEIRNGHDVNPFQSKLLMRNDSSGKRRAERTDHLWADWGIHHLHISDRPTDGTYFSPRSDQILFAWFGRDVALFIDVLPHSGDDLRFSREELIRVVARNWPEVLAPFELKAVASGVPPSDEERKMLRRAGIDAPLYIDGKVYFAPGHGVTSASTSGKVTDAAYRLRRNVQALAHHVLAPDGVFLAALPSGNGTVGRFSLQLHHVGVVVHEETTGVAWTFPEAKFNGLDCAFAQVADALTPPWVTRAIQNAQIPGSEVGGDGDVFEKGTRTSTRLPKLMD
jgi:hypothetical protein